MPVLRYFGWVGGFLLTLLFVTNWMFSEPMARASYVPQWEKSTIRILGS